MLFEYNVTLFFNVYNTVLVNINYGCGVTDSVRGYCVFFIVAGQDHEAAFVVVSVYEPKNCLQYK